MRTKKIGADMSKWYLCKSSSGAWILNGPEGFIHKGGVFKTFDAALAVLRDRLAA